MLLWLFQLIFLPSQLADLKREKEREEETECQRLIESISSISAKFWQRYRFKDENPLYKILFIFQFPVRIQNLNFQAVVQLFSCFSPLSVAVSLSLSLCMTLKYD